MDMKTTCLSGCLMLAVLALAAGAGEVAAPPGKAPEYFVAVDGKPENPGTREAPWDIASALGGKQKVEPGATIWIRGGTYKHPKRDISGYGYEVRLAGAEGRPIQVRAAPAATWLGYERVTIDGGLTMQPPSAHLWLRDLEIMVSDPRPENPVPPDASKWGEYIKRPWGGLNVYTGTNCKFINLVIHDNCQGVSWWSGNSNSELYGCIIYDNGWQGTNRGHGHAIYTQNEKEKGSKTIVDCIMTGGYGWTMHAYGSARASVDNYLMEGNIVYNGGQFLVGSGKPSHNIRVIRNYLYNVNMRIGYNAPENEDCEVRDNVVVNNSINIVKYKQAVKEGNLELAKDAPRPKGALVVLRPNKYDERRAHLVIYNWERAPRVSVDTDGFLKDGEQFRLMNPRELYGQPVHEGVCEGGKISVPVQDEFAAFVVLKAPQERRGAP